MLVAGLGYLATSVHSRDFYILAANNQVSFRYAHQLKRTVAYYTNHELELRKYTLVQGATSPAHAQIQPIQGSRLSTTSTVTPYRTPTLHRATVRKVVRTNPKIDLERYRDACSETSLPASTL